MVARNHRQASRTREWRKTSRQTMRDSVCGGAKLDTPLSGPGTRHKGQRWHTLLWQTIHLMHTHNGGTQPPSGKPHA